MGPTLGPPIDRYARRREAGKEFANSITGFFKNQAEVEALKKYGVNAEGLTGDQRQQVLAHQLKLGAKQKHAEATKRRPEEEREEFKGDEKTEPIEFTTGKKDKYNLENSPLMKKRHGRGSIPEPQAKGEIVPLMTPDEMFNEAARRAEYAQEHGFPISEQETLQNVIQEQAITQAHNEQIEADETRRIAKQEKYGGMAETILKNVYPDANDEITANFMRRGELAAKSGESEAEIKLNLAKEASKFKNTISNIKRDIAPSSGFSGIKKSILGGGREWEKEKSGLRLTVSPLLKDGLYDTARSLLSGKGYMPEQVESIIADLPEGATKVMSQFPKMQKSILTPRQRQIMGKGIGSTFEEIDKEYKQPYTSKDIETINTSVGDIFKSDPSTNLILLRKAFFDKGVDWEAYKDAIDLGVNTGKISLNDDQFNHLSDLNSPPLDNFDQIMHALGWIGK